MKESIEALGWTLVHFCWQAAAIAVLYRVLDAAFRKSRSSLRYALSLGAMLTMLLAGASTLGYEGTRLAREASMRAKAAAEGHPLPDCGAPVASTGIGGSQHLTRTSSDVTLWSSLNESVLRRVQGDPMPWIDSVWLAGVVALSLRMFGGWMTLRRLRSRGRERVPVSIYAAFVRLANDMGIQRRVELRLCSKVAGPMAIGFVKAIVLLPVSALTHLTGEQLEVVLAHELAHIRRGDYLWNMTQTVIETLFFFHPAVWWLSGKTRQLRELCCDDEALACCADPVIYASALLELEEYRHARLKLAMAFHGTEKRSGLKERIVRILGGTHQEGYVRRDVVPLSLAGIAALVGVFLLPLPRVMAKSAAATQQKTFSMGQSSAAVLQPNKISVVAQEEITRSAPAHVASKAMVAEVQQLPEPAPLPQPAHIVVDIPSPAVNLSVAPRINVAVPHIQVVPDTRIVTSPIKIAVPAISVHPKIAAVVAPASSVALAINAVPTVTLSGVILSSGEAGTLTATGHTANDARSNEAYLKGMKDLGYNDPAEIAAMKIHGVTVEYARSMGEAGYGKPSADDLIGLKTFRITTEFAQKMRANGVAPATFHELIQFWIFRVTPEYAAGIKGAGFGALNAQKLVQLKIQDVTPEFASAMHQRFPNMTVDQLIQLKVLRINDEFIAMAKRHGLASVTIDDLVRLRVSGVLDDNAVKP